MSGRHAAPHRRDLVGTRLPDGRYTIDPELHRRWMAAVFATPWDGDVAHPMYLHLASHCGMGVDISAFFELIGTSVEQGVMFGQGHLEFHRPLRVGRTYRVTGRIAEVESKQGASIGAFDLVTCRLELHDEAGLAGVSHETYVVPSEARP